MNILLCADLHIHQHKKSIARLHDCLDVLRWIFKTAKEHKISNIIFAGDLFQDRQKIDVITYKLVFDIFNEYCDGSFKIYLLLGNHDLWHYDKWDINSVQPLSGLPPVTVIDKPSSILIGGTTIDFLPYTHDPINHLLELQKPHKSRKGLKILVGHLAIHGALLNTLHNIYSDVPIEHDGEMSIVDKSLFASWDQVWLGHYHAWQRIEPNIEYIGSPLQLSFGEAFQHKYIIIYDLKTGDKEYIENTFSPEHYIIPSEDLSKYKIRNNFVRVEVEDIGSSDLIDLRDGLEEENPGSLEILPVSNKEDDIDIKDAKAILQKEDEMLKEWIKASKEKIGDMDEKKLLKAGKTVCGSN